MIKKYYDKLSAYPRLRVFIIFVGILVLLLVVMRTFSSHQIKRSVIPASNISMSPVKVDQSHKVGEGEYNQLQEIQKRQQLENAELQGKSYFEGNLLQGGLPVAKIDQKPVKRAVSTPISPEAFYQQEKNLKQEKVEAQKSEEAQPAVMVQNQGPSPQELAAAIQAQESMMRTQLTRMSSDWAIPSFSTTGSPETASQGEAAGGNGTGNVVSTSVAVKAGTIFLAVLGVGLSSDQPGTPVIATVVSGKLKGAKLLGTFSLQKDRLVVQFHTMTMNSRPNSIGINAYAIDPETAQNALASNVDNHYLLRYGSLFAAGFLEGFGNAWSNAQYYNYYPNSFGNTYNIPPAETTTRTAAYQGLGQVGTNLGNEVSKVFNTPPTVTLNAGSALGILFMSDLSM